MNDTIFFVVSKLGGLLIRPETWLILGAISTWIQIMRQRILGARRIAFITALSMLIVAIFPVGDLIFSRLESRFEMRPDVAQVTGVIVLGGGEAGAQAARWGGVQVNRAAERFTEAVSLSRRFPEARIVYSGGSGALRDLGTYADTSAGIAKQLFDDLGVEPDRVSFESHSRNTAENARQSFKLVQPREGETWILVTSAYHMPRAFRSFERAGWPGLVPWPVDYVSVRLSDGIGWNLGVNLARLNSAIKELIGLAVYDWSDR